MKKKLSLLMVALMAIAAFAATVARRAPGDTIKTVDGTTTTWDLTAITAEMGSTLSTLWTQNGNYYQTNGQTAEMPAFAPGLTFIDTNSSGGKCRIYVAGENPGQGFYFGGNAAAIDVPVSAGQTLIVTTTGGGGVKSLNDKVSFTITGTGPYVSTAIIPDDVSSVKFARNAGSATYCTTIVTKTETKAPANLKVTSEAAVVLPVGATSEISYTTDSKADVTFESSAPDVATVSNAGVIEAVASGASVITVSQAETDDCQAGVAQVSVAVPYAHTAAAEYTIGKDTYGFSDANNNYYFTNGFTMSNSGNKTYGNGSLAGSMKYSANTVYTINIPEGVTITSATVTGRSNYGSDNNTAYWGNLFGEDLSTEALPYSDAEPATKIIKFAEGATGTLTFTPAGNQVQFIITLAADGGDVPAAQEETINFTAAGEGTNPMVYTTDHFTFTFDKGKGLNNPAYVASASETRLYAKGSLSIAAKAGEVISKIVYTATLNANKSGVAPTIDAVAGTTTEGTWDAENWTWTGSDKEVVMTTSGSAGNTGFTKIVVTYTPAAPAAVATPTFDPATGTYTENQTVTISCATEGADIYYALGEGEFQKYTEALTITETTTVKAYAQKGEDKSATATATYTINKQVAAATIAELNALGNEALFNFTGEALVVAKPTAKYVYVKDATASSLIYDASGENTTAAEEGKTIAANWTGKVSIYNQLTELVPYAALVMKDGEAVAVEYPEVAAADMSAENVNKVVTLKGITGYAVDGKKVTITIGETTVVGYNQFGLEIAAAEEGKTYEMVGAIGRYNETVQFWPISIARTPEVVDVTVDAADITGGDITAALASKVAAITEAGDKVGDITINLAENGAYTISAPIEAGASVSINGAAGATIDASGLTDAFIKMSSTPAIAKVTSGQYVVTTPAKIENVKITGLTKSVYTDNGIEYAFETFTINNCVFEYETQASYVLDFSKSMAINFNITNSTFYSKTSGTANFISLSGKRPWQITGYEEETGKLTVDHSTFYNLAKSKQFLNTNTLKGQKYLYVMNSNIFVDCSNKKIYGNMTNNAKQVTTDSKNTYMFDGVFFAETGNNGDAGLQTDPYFKDAANGDFTVNAGSQQAKFQTGDVTHWPVTYDPTLDPAVLWYSATPVAAEWGSANIKVDAEKLANVKVGDILHVAVEGVTATPGNAYSAQVVLKDGSFADLEGGVLCGDGSVTDATFVVTGDILARIQATGLLASGAGYSTTMVSLEAGTATGSDASIWVGNSNTYVSVNAKHFLNANGGHYETIDEQLTWVGGVEAGDIIRVTCTEAAGVEEADRYIIAQYSGNDTGWQWTDYENFPAVKTATGFVFVVPESNVAELKTDGIIINQKGYNITQVELVKSQVVDVELALETGAVINEALAAKTTEITAAGDKVGNITINLAENGAYTVSAPIEAGASVSINGAAGATIDASGLTDAFIKMSSTPAIAKVTSGQYVVTTPAKIENVKITGLTKSVYTDNGIEYAFETFTINNCVFEYETQASYVLDFSKSMAINFNITNSTFYSKTSGTANFISLSGKRPWQITGYEEETGKLTVDHSTFYNLAKSKQFLNTNTLKGQKYLYVMNSNIFVDCSNKKIYGNMTNNAKQVTTDSKNTYMFDGVFFAETGNNGDAGLQTDPYFKDAANGDFAIASNSAQAKAEGGQTGDARWGTYDAGFAIKAVNAEGITITPEVAYAAEGTKVYATYTVAEGYEMDKPEFVDDNGNAIEFAEGQIGLEKVGDVEKMFIIMPAKNVTIKAKASKVSQITLALSQENGSATCLSVNAEDPSTFKKKEGKEIYLAITPDAGYEAEISVMAGETAIEVIAATGTYSEQTYTHKFTMPAADVTVTVTFKSATGINSIAADKMKDATIYTISGQRVDKAQKGLYIINGKKVVIK